MALRLIRALPGERPVLPPSPTWDLPRGLTPGSRRQDHTISPYATLLRPAADLDPFRKSSRYAWDCRVHRILCPTYRDDRETSLSGHETGQSILQIRILVNRIILLRRA